MPAGLASVAALISTAEEGPLPKPEELTPAPAGPPEAAPEVGGSLTTVLMRTLAAGDARTD
eukprot:2335250-Prorocentrum_lima.AAC.1